MLTVTTWNVLHRVHADNWREDVAAHHLREVDRIAAIASRVAALDTAIIGLQEVSGDQLAALHGVRSDARRFTLRYPRVPRPRHGPTPLTDVTEFLVTLVSGPATLVAAEASRDDPGKGLLAIWRDGVLVINTHVSFGDRRVAQLARIAALARAHAGPCVVLGDFNADRDTVASLLGEGFVVAAHGDDALPTRPRSGGDKPMSIDHVAVRGATVGTAAVFDAGGLSDHNLVGAQIVGAS